MREVDYYIGLDLGTSSLGWAITDKDYNIPKAKGKRLWGVRLFDEAETAADRRVHRSARRRNNRTKNRLKILQMLFADEIAKVDPDFYIRLRESFYIESDKQGLANNSKNTLFNDPSFTDKDFHKKYPTIWHLRKTLMEGDETHDIRLYFLAIHHILKNRGHFLYESEISVTNDFTSLWQDFCSQAENLNIPICDTVADSVESTIKDRTKGKNDKKKYLKDLIFVEQEEDYPGAGDLSGLLVGSTVSLNKIFALESEEDHKLSFDDGVFEDKLPDIEQAIGSDNIDLVIVAKKIYDFGLLSALLKDDKYISHAMVKNYCQHKKDLTALKQLLKTDHPEHFKNLFKSRQSGEINYNAYIGEASENVKTFKKKCSQADFNKEIAKVIEQISGFNDKVPADIQNWLTSHHAPADLYARAKEGDLLPKQKGQAKGTIPMQLHLAELKLICQSLAKSYPSFAAKDPKDGLTKCEKLTKLLTFRIPYYVGPLVNKTRSQFSWGDEEINEIIYPWNFDRLIDKNKRANEFIHRMTNECTYLLGEEVLPKFSLLYQKYMLLNELNNLKVNGIRLPDATVKQRIFEQVFEQGEVTGTVTLNRLKKWMIENRLITSNDELSGIDFSFKSKLTSQKDFKRIFADNPMPETHKIEKSIELITVLGEEKKMLKTKLVELLDCDEDTANKISKLPYKDWGKLSKKFLTSIYAPIKGQKLSIIDALWETNLNLMELLSSSYGFVQAVSNFNAPKKPTSTKIIYTDVENLYCSPAVKRAIWQAIRVTNELVRVQGRAPKKIFLEVTREDKTNKKRTLSRKIQLETLYKQIKNNPEISVLLKELQSKEDRSLQIKKLYLYFTQMGKCAYSGDKIEIEDLMTKSYDIDHIYPRSKTKDDSITRNLVLVRAKLNREKTNTYPISGSIRSKMSGIWAFWEKSGLITKEKYERLVRFTILTDDELSGFIARQIVETSQANKAIIEILKRIIPDAKIIYSKAEHVSDFRHLFSGDRKDRTGNIVTKGHPEFIKLRELNDFHHAKDAYLNIVVGNVYNSHFTSDPRRWLKSLNASAKEKYTVSEKVLFSTDDKYQWAWDETWRGPATFDTVKSTLARNDILWTRMAHETSGQMSDANIVKGSDGLLPIKKDERLKNTKQYGGYNSLKGAFFSLIELDGKKNTRERRLIGIPIIYKNDIANYISSEFSDKNPRIVIPNIPIKSLIKINGFPLHISGRTGDSIVFTHGIQTIFDFNTQKYLKNISSIIHKLKTTKDKYRIDEEKDKVSMPENQNTFQTLVGKLSAFGKMPGTTKLLEKIKNSSGDFAELTLVEQCRLINNFVIFFSCNAAKADFSSCVKSSKYNIKSSNQILQGTKLIHQSPTGLFESEIDLSTVESKN